MPALFAITTDPTKAINQLQAAVKTLTEQVKAMSDTLANELTALQTALGNLQTAVTAATTKISDLATQLAAAAQGAPTPDQLAQMAADATTIQAEADALNAAVNPPAQPASS